MTNLDSITLPTKVCLVRAMVFPVVMYDELLSINVPWSQEFSGVLRIWT